MYGPNEDYLIFMFFIFILQRPAVFFKCMEDVDMDTNVCNLDEGNRIHKNLLDWLVSSSPDAQMALYQSSIYFSSKATDEQSKSRFMLVYKYLMEKNPKAAFKLYPFVLSELRRLSKYSNNSSTMILAFEIIKMAVKSSEYLRLPEIERAMYKTLEERGLRGDVYKRQVLLVGHCFVHYTLTILQFTSFLRQHSSFSQKKLEFIKHSINQMTKKMALIYPMSSFSR